MPLYDYKCSACEHAFESLQKIATFNAPCEQPCPSCNTQGSVKRHITGCANIVSGVGELMCKTPKDFRDKLDLIRKNNLGSNIET